MSAALRKKNAGHAPLSQRRARVQSYIAAERYEGRRVRAIRRPSRPSTLVVPMLEELASIMGVELLASVRRQVEPGERIAIYVAPNAPGRALIIGPERTHVTAPRLLDARWTLAGLVEVFDEGERSLPVPRLTPRSPRPAA